MDYLTPVSQSPKKKYDTMEIIIAQMIYLFLKRLILRLMMKTATINPKAHNADL